MIRLLKSGVLIGEYDLLNQVYAALLIQEAVDISEREFDITNDQEAELEKLSRWFDLDIIDHDREAGTYCVGFNNLTLNKQVLMKIYEVTQADYPFEILQDE